MTQANVVVELHAGPRVAEVRARRNATVAEQRQVAADLAALRGARGRLVLDGQSTEGIDLEIVSLTARLERLGDALAALDSKETQAVVAETEQGLRNYNQKLIGCFELAGDLIARWAKNSKEAGGIVGELMPVLDQIRVLASPGRNIDDFSQIMRLPGAMVTQLCLRIVPPDKRVERSLFAALLPATPPYEMAKAFAASGAPAMLLAEAQKNLLVDVPPPPPEAA